MAAAPAHSLRIEGTHTRFSVVCKRVIDIAGSTLLLLLSAPVLAAFAMAVKLCDGGPAFHRRKVVGLRGAFDAFKLRSMRVDADQILERDSELQKRFSLNFKLQDDPRVTRVGRFMRRYGIDELPQLWNVFRGEMSLVGPRMISPAELGKFGDAAWIFDAVKPGLTGYWQTERRDGDYPERVRMEVAYVQNWSLTEDLKILLRTPLRVLRQAGVR